ncbi:MAG: signal peptidase I [Gemmatimonadales bacterium]
MMGKLTRWLWDWAKTIVVALVIWFTFSTFVLQAFRITSSSMESTLLIGDVLYVNKMLYGAEVPVVHRRLPAIREPRLGDIVVFESVETPGLTVVKRLVGVPGDTLAMTDGVLSRNGTAVTEPWVAADRRLMPTDAAGRTQIRRWTLPLLIGPPQPDYDPDPNHWGPIVVPAAAYFMMGDNRRDSYDSRFWGFLPARNIRGRASVIYFSYDADTYKPLPFLTNIRWRRLLSVPR